MTCLAYQALRRVAAVITAAFVTGSLLVLVPPAAQASTPISLTDGNALTAHQVCSTGTLFSCFAERQPGASPGLANFSTYTLTPSGLSSAYRIPASSATNTVAIIDAYRAPNVESDLATYRSHYGLPACSTASGCLRIVGQSATPSLPAGTDSGWATETALDLDSVSAACPTCHLLLVEANDPSINLFYAVKAATDLGAKFVSMSWGAGEFSGLSSYDAAFFAAPGVAYFASTGDSGYQAGPSYPASSPNVIAVGGTSLTPDSGQPRGWFEQAWGSVPTEGGGSGCSASEAKPAYQAGIPNGLCARRAESDVSAAADPAFGGMSVYDSADGGFEIVGGTSEAAPLVAAMYASAGTPNSSPVATLYSRANAFNDITGNGNGSCGTALCTAASGWDGPTGLGTPNGVSGFGAVPAAGTQAGSLPVSTPPGSPAPGSPTPGSPAPVSPPPVSVPPVRTPPSVPAPPVSTAPIDTITFHNPGPLRTFAGTPAALSVTATSSTNSPLSYTASGLPAGVTANSAGRLTGIPTSAGVYTVSIRAIDAAGYRANTSFSWVVMLHRLVATPAPHLVGKLLPGCTAAVGPIVFRLDSSSGPIVRPSILVQWYIDGRAVRGATHSFFTVPAAALGHRISFVLSARVASSDQYQFALAQATLRR